MARTKVKHSGKGPAVVDRSGWRIEAGDKHKFLPKAADAATLRALSNGRLVRVGEEKTEPVSEPIKNEDAVEEGDSIDEEAFSILKVLSQIIIDEGSELTADGKPTVEALRDSYESEKGNPENITAKVRDAVFNELG